MEDDPQNAATHEDQTLTNILASRRLLAAHKHLQHQPLHASLQQHLQHLLEMLDALPNQQGWAPVNQAADLRAWHKAMGPLHSLKVFMRFPGARIDQPLTMGWEFDLVHTWNSYATATHILQVWRGL